MGWVSAQASEMKPDHQVTGLYFEGNVMILTIDGQEKRFQVSEISPALQHASDGH